MEQDKKPTTEISQKGHEIISFFEKDPSFVYVYKKTEKLASAIYIVSNLFSDSEPMKWTLRKKASELVSFTLSYKDISESNQADFIYSIRSKALELVSLLEISFRGGLISQMNYSVIKHEFSNLVGMFNGSVGIHKDSAGDTIPHTFFDVPKIESEVSYRHEPRLPVHTHSTGSFARAPHSDLKDTARSPLQSNDQFKRTNRQTIILNLIKKRREVTIKDIAQVIRDCSEKTIQRELIAFINAGVLKRTGERRWSKYSFAQDASI